MNDHNSPSASKLKPVLGLWDLVFYGIVLNQPVAAVGLFGLVSILSAGHMVTTLLLSMIAMLFTAMSYGRMAAIFPSAGSAYTYVGKGLNPHLGFIAGWVMILCYLIIPLINTVFGVLSVQRLFPGIPFSVGVIVFVSFITIFNLLGVQSSMKANKIMLYLMLSIIMAFIFLAVHYIIGTLGIEGLFSTKPLYNPHTFNSSSIFEGTALVALTYVGFDGITTLAEDVRNPKRNILAAILIVCLFTGIFSSIQMYLAQQSAQTMWIENGTAGNFYQRIPADNVETAFMTVCAQVGGPMLFKGMTIIMFVACLGSGLAGQLGAARLLFGMGKDNILPRQFFGYLGKKNNAPVLNILLIGVITFAGTFMLNYQKTAELINFAALIAFMGVNLAAIRQLYFRQLKEKRKLVYDLIIPACGFLFCLWIWINLPSSPRIMGSVWLISGIIYLAFSTKGFRKQPVEIDFSEA